MTFDRQDQPRSPQDTNSEMQEPDPLEAAIDEYQSMADADTTAYFPDEDEFQFTPDTNEPTVVLIGTLDREGVLSALRASGRQYLIKRIDSSPANWATIVEILEGFPVRAALVKLTRLTYSYLVTPEYDAVSDRLLRAIAAVPNTIFAYEKILSDVVQEESPNSANGAISRGGYYSRLPQKIVEAVHEKLNRYGLQVTPYGSNAELTVLAMGFVEDAEHGLLFRVYVPSGRMWANETDRLMQLFREYLTRVGHGGIRLKEQRTSQGTIYELFATPDTTASTGRTLSLAHEFDEFSHFLDLVTSNPEEAESLLRNKDVDAREVASIMTRFAKEGRRLQVDIRHEREQKLLSIRQRLESELVDVLPPGLGQHVISSLVDSALPPIAGVGTALVGEQRLLSVTATQGANVTINVRPEIVNAVNSVVAREINGDVHLTANDRRLLEVIAQHAGERQAELASAVRELADESAPKPGRIRARQKLKGFLWQLASKVPDIGAGLLQSYLEGRLGL